MYDHLTELVSEQSLLWRQESYRSTYLKTHALYKFLQIKLFLQLDLCLLKEFVAFGSLVPLQEAHTEALWIEFLVEAEVFDQVSEQIFPFRVFLGIEVFFFKF